MKNLKRKMKNQNSKFKILVFTLCLCAFSFKPLALPSTKTTERSSFGAGLPYVYSEWKHFTVKDGLPNDHVFAIKAEPSTSTPKQGSSGSGCLAVVLHASAEADSTIGTSSTVGWSTM
jgi:hypothetical protein